MWTVSLIEDQNEYQELIKWTLRSSKDFRFISAYATAEAAVEGLPREKPDVALVDIKLPSMDGIECIRELRAIRPRLPTQFIMLTGHADEELVLEAFKVGALGYLLKADLTGSKLCAAIKELIVGGAPMTPTIARKVVAYVGGKPPPNVSLSSQEQELLRLLADGYSYKEIAAKLSISLETVRQQVRAVYSKLEVHSRKEAINFIQDQQPPRN